MRKNMSAGSIVRSIIARVIVSSLLAVALVSVPAAALAADGGYYSVPWSPDIRVVEGDRTRVLTYAEWVGLGEPSPTRPPISYVKATWSATVFAQIDWPNAATGGVVEETHPLTWNQYVAAWRPPVTYVGHVRGTQYVQWYSTSTEIHARTPEGAVHKLTHSEWIAAGRPSPARADRGYYRAPWSNVIHEVTSAGGIRQISYPEWVSVGTPAPALTPVSYVKTPWSPAIYGLITWPIAPEDRKVDQVAAITWSDFVAAGSPRFDTVVRIPGDAFVKYTIADTVFHVVQGLVTPLTASDWSAAGSPWPSTMTAPSPAYIRDTLVVNKSLPLPWWYGGGLTHQLTGAFDAMRGAAAGAGLSIYIASGYRSYASQTSVYNSYVAQDGQALADTYSARPGHSEHQTGLAIDLNSVHVSFASTPEGRWVSANAHRFGFIVRYPAGKEHITGYTYEPWHLRHVGVPLATHLYASNLTLEEYMMVPSRY